MVANAVHYLEMKLIKVISYFQTLPFKLKMKFLVFVYGKGKIPTKFLPKIEVAEDEEPYLIILFVLNDLMKAFGLVRKEVNLYHVFVRVMTNSEPTLEDEAILTKLANSKTLYTSVYKKLLEMGDIDANREHLINNSADRPGGLKKWLSEKDDQSIAESSQPNRF